MQDDILFSYGTLRQPEVQEVVFGRILDGWDDTISGYSAEVLVITDPVVIATSGSDRHPVLRPAAELSAAVPGTAFRVSAADIDAADRYEVDDYVRIRVPLASGAEAWVYVFDE
ncbi:gamma-glutamylcyclotransferase family protein [Pseudonocardia sp. DLS-67]